MNCRAGAVPATKEQGCVCLCRSNFVHSKNSVGVQCSELPFVLGEKNQAHPWLAAFVSLRPEHWEPCVSGVEPLWGMCGHAPAFQPGQLETAQSPLKLSPPPKKILLHTPLCLCILSKLGESHGMVPQLIFIDSQWGFNVLQNRLYFCLHEATSYFLTKAKLFYFFNRRCFRLMCHLDL